MANRQRLNLSLNLRNPRHRKVWETLSAIPQGQRTELVCSLILKEESSVPEDLLRKIIREELAALQYPINQIPETKAEDVSDDVLGFLRSL